MPDLRPDGFIAGARVRITSDPGRVGVLTGKELERRGQLMLQVSFPDNLAWQPLRTLEIAGTTRLDPLTLLAEGRFGTADDLRRTLTQVRLTGRLADMVYSMEATNTDFYAYQYKPVLKALRSPTRGLLIADEVGLGKTIEAGLVWVELKSRYDMRRVVVLCPAALREKWIEELRQRFGVVASVSDAAETLRVLRASLAGDEPDVAIVASIQGLRPPRDWDESDARRAAATELARFLDDNAEEAPLVDLLIIDEAHHLRNPKSQNHLLGKLFRATSDHVLLLSATPVHNTNRDLQSLLTLLDPDTFFRPQFFDRILEANAPLVRARDGVIAGHLTAVELDALLQEAAATELLRDNRQLKALRSRIYDDAELKRHDVRSDIAYRLENVNLLGHVLTRTRKRDVTEWRVVRDPVPEFVNPSEVERRFYDAVTRLVTQYCMRWDRNDRFLVVTPQRQMSSCMPAALQWWLERRDLLEGVVDEDMQDGADEKIGTLTAAIASGVEDIATVDELTANDSKYTRLEAIITKALTDNPGEKLIVFSTFRRTLEYLDRRLGKSGVSTLLLMGGQKETKQSMVARFRNPHGPSVLLSSEVGAEGVDMQFSHIVINYDLPWNPMRVEQRIGRVDRLGQDAKVVVIWNLFYSDTIDARIYTRLYEKLDLCRNALGDFEAVLGEEIRELTADLFKDFLTPGQQEERIDQTALALENLRKENAELEDRAAHLTAYGDYILNQIHAARELHRWIEGRDLFVFLRDFLTMNYQGFELREVDADKALYDVRLPPELRAELQEFIRSRKLPSTALVRNASGAVRCRFESKVVGDTRGRVETISQFHPLVRFVSQRITEQVEQLRPAVAIALSASADLLVGLSPGVYVIGSQLWSVRGLQVAERLGYAGCRLTGSREFEPVPNDDAERLLVAAAREGTTWLEVRGRLDLDEVHKVANNQLFGELQDGYESFVERLSAENEDRASLQTANLQRHLDDQLAILGVVRQKHVDAGRESLVKATEGRVRSLKSRIQTALAKVDASRQLTSNAEDVCVAIVEVN